VVWSTEVVKVGAIQAVEGISDKAKG
jgi:hypothetical protein